MHAFVWLFSTVQCILGCIAMHWEHVWGLAWAGGLQWELGLDWWGQWLKWCNYPTTTTTIIIVPLLDDDGDLVTITITNVNDAQVPILGNNFPTSNAAILSTNCNSGVNYQIPLLSPSVICFFLSHLWSFLCWFFKEGIWCWRWEGGWEGAATGCWFAIPTLSHALKIPTLSRALKIPTVSHSLKIPTLSHALKTHSGEKSNSPHSHSHCVTCWSSTFSHHTVWYGTVGRVVGAHPSPAAFYHIAAGAGPGLRGHGDDPTHPPTPPPSLPTGGKCGGRGLGSGLDMHRQRCF